MWTWRERSGDTAGAKECQRRPGNPRRWEAGLELVIHHSPGKKGTTLLTPWSEASQSPQLWLKAPHLWCPGKQPQEANPGGNIILCNDVLLFHRSPLPTHCPRHPGQLLQLLLLWEHKSTRVRWFVNKHHKFGFDSSFPCLFRQRVGKKQPVGQTRAPSSVFVKVLLEQGCAHSLTCFPWLLSHGRGRGGSKAGKIYHLSFRGEVCWPLACTWESNVGNVKNTDKTLKACAVGSRYIVIAPKIEKM